MKEQAMVYSGDAKRLGIGAVYNERRVSYCKMLVDSGKAPAGPDIRTAHTLRFVNKRFGM
jgi:NitT/TauT family transport system substrate-binding protein